MSIAIQLHEAVYTPRFVIRVVRPGDGRVLHAGIIESLPQLQPWMEWLQTTPSAEDCETFCRRCYAAYLNNLAFEALVWHRENRTFSGYVSLRNIDWNLGHFELGGWMKTSLSGNGYPREVMRGMAAHCFKELGAKRVYGLVDDRNLAAIVLNRRSGFTLEGVLKSYRKDVNGKLCDMRMYAMTECPIQD